VAAFWNGGPSEWRADTKNTNGSCCIRMTFLRAFHHWNAENVCSHLAHHSASVAALRQPAGSHLGAVLPSLTAAHKDKVDQTPLCHQDCCHYHSLPRPMTSRYLPIDLKLNNNQKTALTHNKLIQTYDKTFIICSLSVCGLIG